MPLVGRDGLVDRMVTRLDSGGCAAFVVAGSAGVGKTRLAAEVARYAAGKGHATAHVVATKSAATIPFGAFAPIVPEMSTRGDGLLGLLRQASDAILERKVGARALLLVVDDAHLLDDGSAALVHQLVHESSCSVVASVRTPGPTPDPITTLWKDGLAERVDLDPLSEAEVEQLVRGALGGPMTGAGIRWLWETSAGNPLYVRELLAGATQSGSLYDGGGMWLLRLPLPAPTRLSELVASRLSGLPSGTADVVDLLAVGEPLSLSLLSTIAEAATVEDAEQRGLISVREQGDSFEVGLSHPLYGEVRRREMPRSRLRRLSGALAEALQASGPHRHDDELRIARWQLDAGVQGDPVLLGRAAKTAREMNDLELAERLGRAAVAAGGGVEAGLALAEAEFFSGRHEEAEAVLAALVPQCRNDHDAARVANARAYNLGTLMGQPDAAAAVLESALATIVEPAARCRVLYRRAADRTYSGQARLGLADAAPLLASDDDAVVLRGMQVTSLALSFLGRTEEAVAMAAAGLEVHRRSDDRSKMPEGQLIGATLGLAAGGRLAEAETSAQGGYERCLEAHDPDAVATFCLLRGCVYVERGLLTEAARMFREGVTINRELQDVAALRWCLGGVALADAMQGDVEKATAAVAELDELQAHWLDAFDAVLVDRGRAWLHAAAGETSRARADLQVAADRCAAREEPVNEARLVHDLARLGEPGTAAVRLAELVSCADGALVPAFADHAAALARPTGSGLEVAAKGFEAVGALGLAAEASASAALAYRGEGLARLSASCARKAEELRERCGGPAPPVVSPLGDVVRLTSREREVAALAASGSSSREIAERLYLSVRTVDNHLQRVYTKLGVTKREDLRALL